MYLGSWSVGDYITFVCNTHTPATGAATDADAAPTYRIFENEVEVPLLTGTMAKLDDANTTGFYSERVQITEAAGFERGKSYNIYIEATVGGITGTTSHDFQVGALCTGTGPVELEYTMLSTVDGSPIPDCWVGVYTDEAMTHFVASGYTDNFGIVIFWLTPGTYFLKRVKSSWNFENPDEELVS